MVHSIVASFARTRTNTTSDSHCQSFAARSQHSYSLTRLVQISRLLSAAVNMPPQTRAASSDNALSSSPSTAHRYNTRSSSKQRDEPSSSAKPRSRASALASPSTKAEGADNSDDEDEVGDSTDEQDKEDSQHESSAGEWNSGPENEDDPRPRTPRRPQSSRVGLLSITAAAFTFAVGLFAILAMTYAFRYVMLSDH